MPATEQQAGARSLALGCIGLLLLAFGQAPALVTRYIGPIRTPPDFTDFTSLGRWLSNRWLDDEYLFIADSGTYTGTFQVDTAHNGYFPLTIRPDRHGND